MTWLGCAGLLAVSALCGCSRTSTPGDAHDARSTSAPLAEQRAKPDSKPSLQDAKATASSGEGNLAVAPDDDLKLEEQEANPYSETVTLKLSVTPAVRALVMWGGKQMAKLSPGQMEADIVRPRGSGPLDLEIKAEGFLPYHTRLYADRNDKVNVRLYRDEEAPGLFGYKRSSADKTK
jgi:hypothetical protein